MLHSGASLQHYKVIRMYFKSVPVSKLLALLGLVTSYSGLLACRYFLGLCEGGFSFKDMFVALILRLHQVVCSLV